MGDSNSGFFFPDEFPYDDFTGSDLSSSVSSVDSDEDDKEDAKVLDLGCSPQSTLCSDRDWEEPRKPSVEHNRHFQIPQFQKLKQQQILRERRAVFLSGAVPKRESVGTGVFLPRASVAPTSDATQTRRKPSYSTVVLPARVVQALNLNLEEIGARPIFPGGAVILDKEAMKARRRLQSRQRATQHHVQPSESSQSEVHLPPDWTY